MKISALVICSCALALILPLHGQQTGTGIYSFGSYDSKGFDTINLGNLNVHAQIPIVSKSGRGMPFTYSLTYDSLVWSGTFSSGTYYWMPNTNFGFTGLTTSALTGFWTNTITDILCPPGSPYAAAYIINNYVYYDPFGGTHPLNYSRNGCYSPELDTGNGLATDGSGYTLKGGYIYASNGTQLNAPFETSGSVPSSSGSITDLNGNTITNNGQGTFTDTLGVNVLSIAGSGNASSPLTFTYPVTEQANGARTATATVYYKAYTVRLSLVAAAFLNMVRPCLA